MRHQYPHITLVPAVFDGRCLRLSNYTGATLPAPDHEGKEIKGVEAFALASSALTVEVAVLAGGRGLGLAGLFDIQSGTGDPSITVRDGLDLDQDSFARRVLQDVSRGIGAALSLGKVDPPDPYTSARALAADIPPSVGEWDGPFVYELRGTPEQAPVKLVTADEFPETKPDGQT